MSTVRTKYFGGVICSNDRFVRIANERKHLGMIGNLAAGPKQRGNRFKKRTIIQIVSSAVAVSAIWIYLSEHEA